VNARAVVGRLRATAEGQGSGRVALAVLAARRYLSDAMGDRAASLAYYGMLSLFPSLLIISSAVRVVGGSGAADDIASYARDHGTSGALSDTLRSAIETAQDAPAPGAGAIGLIGLAALIYGASRAFTAAGRALDTIGGALPRPRPLMRRAQDIGWTLVVVTMGVATFVLLLLSGEVLDDFLGLFGLSHATASIWVLARWPAIVFLVLCATATVRWAAPTGTRPRFRLFSPGAVVSVATWLVASIGFSVYVGQFASYNATYGAFAGAVIILLWIWLGAAALLYGAELDAVMSGTVAAVDHQPIDDEHVEREQREREERERRDREQLNERVDAGEDDAQSRRR
jgi:membrane protein